MKHSLKTLEISLQNQSGDPVVDLKRQFISEYISVADVGERVRWGSSPIEKC